MSMNVSGNNQLSAKELQQLQQAQAEAKAENAENTENTDSSETYEFSRGGTISGGSRFGFHSSVRVDNITTMGNGGGGGGSSSPSNEASLSDLFSSLGDLANGIGDLVNAFKKPSGDGAVNPDLSDFDTTAAQKALSDVNGKLNSWKTDTVNSDVSNWTSTNSGVVEGLHTSGSQGLTEAKTLEGNISNAKSQIEQGQSQIDSNVKTAADTQAKAQDGVSAADSNLSSAQTQGAQAENKADGAIGDAKANQADAEKNANASNKAADDAVTNSETNFENLKTQLAQSDKTVAQFSSQLKNLDFKIGTLEAQLSKLDGSKNYTEWKDVKTQLDNAKKTKAQTEANSKKAVMENTKLKADVAKAADNLRAAETTQSTVEAENKTNIENANANVAAAEDAAAEVKQQVSDGISLAKEQVDNMNASLDKATEAFKNAEASGASFADKANILNQKIDIAENQLLPELNTESNNALKVKLATPTITNPPAAESAQPSVQALGQQGTGNAKGNTDLEFAKHDANMQQKLNAQHKSGKVDGNFAKSVQQDLLSKTDNAISQLKNRDSNNVQISGQNIDDAIRYLRNTTRSIGLDSSGQKMNKNFTASDVALRKTQIQDLKAQLDGVKDQFTPEQKRYFNEVVSLINKEQPGVLKMDNQKEA